MDLTPYIPYCILGLTFCIAWIYLLHRLEQTAVSQDDEDLDDDSDEVTIKFWDAWRQEIFKR